MVPSMRICFGIVIALANVVSGFHDDLGHTIEFPTSDHRILEVVDQATGHLGKRQAGLPTQHNISELVTPLSTGRWAASVEAQLQTSQADISTLKCTLQICAGPTLCGAAKSIGKGWSTFLLKIQLKAHEPQTISFVTSCSTPAYVAIRNLVIPGQAAGAATITAVQTATTLLPATTAISTVISVETGNAALGLAGSIIIMNNCKYTWISIFGDDDFEHVPPKGVAIVPADPMQRFGAGVILQSLAGESVYCATSSSEEYIGCAYGIVTKRQLEPEPPFHPTHPLYINDRYISLDGFVFDANDIVKLDCLREVQPTSDDQQTSLTISNTGCGGLTVTGVHTTENDGWRDVNMAYAGNTAASVSLRYPASITLQTWSRNEPGCVQGTYYSVDGAALVNSAWLSYTIEDGAPHSFEFVCNYTTRSPSGALTQVVYSTSTATISETTTSTETDTQWFTSTESITSTETTTERTTDTILTTTTETTTEFQPTTEFATTTCAAETSVETTTTSSESSYEPAPEPSEPAPGPAPDPDPYYHHQLVINRCPLKTEFAVVLFQAQTNAAMLFTSRDSEELVVIKGDPETSFFPVSGGELCVDTVRAQEAGCSYEKVTVRLYAPQDTVHIRCPEPHPALPDMTNTIPILWHNNVGSGPAGCNYFAYQIGCEPGNYCLGKGYENTQGENNFLALKYPMLSPGARLRVWQIGTLWTQWRITLGADSSGTVMDVRQSTYNWLEIDVPESTTSITLEASCSDNY